MTGNFTAGALFCYRNMVVNYVLVLFTSNREASYLLN